MGRLLALALPLVALGWGSSGAVGSRSCRAAEAAPTRPRPNILLIVVDDLGYGEFPQPPGTGVETPHLDALARDGVRFTQGYVTASFCSPSRAGLLTGRLQSRFGHEHNPVGAANLTEQAGVPLTERTLADELRRAGYATGLVGKWHLGALPQHRPVRRGFDSSYGFLHEGHYYVPGPPWQDVVTWLRVRELPAGQGPRQVKGDVIRSSHLKTDEPDYDGQNPLWRLSAEGLAEQVVEPEYLTDAWGREAIDFIERQRDRPWFLLLAHNAPHSPMQARKTDLARLSGIDDVHRRLFGAMVERLDTSIGRVLRRLEELELDRRTLVVFVSDNGGPTAELTSSNAPLRGGKGTLYEGGIRVPFAIRWPGTIAGGRTVEQPVSSLDIFPTALGAAAAPPDPGADSSRRLDGVDLGPWLRGEAEAPGPRTFYWRMGARAALRDHDWKLVRQGTGAATRHELYDLARDLGESTDLAATHPEMLARLRARLEAWEHELP